MRNDRKKRTSQARPRTNGDARNSRQLAYSRHGMRDVLECESFPHTTQPSGDNSGRAKVIDLSAVEDRARAR